MITKKQTLVLRNVCDFNVCKECKLDDSDKCPVDQIIIGALKWV